MKCIYWSWNIQITNLKHDALVNLVINTISESDLENQRNWSEVIKTVSVWRISTGTIQSTSTNIMLQTQMLVSSHRTMVFWSKQPPNNGGFSKLDLNHHEIKNVTEFQRSGPLSNHHLAMVRRVSCGLQLATVPELQVCTPIFFAQNKVAALLVDAPKAWFGTNAKYTKMT